MHLKWEKLVSSLCFHTQLVPRYASVSVNNTSGACEAQPSGNKMQLAAVNLSAQDRADLFARLHAQCSPRIRDETMRLRGFYLKCAQGISTRTDFVPEPYLTWCTELQAELGMATGLSFGSIAFYVILL